jgi:hypothetical protein
MLRCMLRCTLAIMERDVHLDVHQEAGWRDARPGYVGNDHNVGIRVR